MNPCFFFTKFAVSFDMLKTYLRLRIKTDKTFFFIICQESKSKGKQTHFCKINSRFVDLELGAWCACDRKLLILFLPIFFQNITIKLWMWPLTNDLILKDPISSSKSTKKAWKKDFPFQFWLWPNTCQLMQKDFAGAEITDKPDITVNFSYGKRNYWKILQNYTKNAMKMSRNCLWNCPSLYIQLVNRPHFGTWILLLGPFW